MATSTEQALYAFNDPITQLTAQKHKGSTALFGGDFVEPDIARDLGAELGYDRPLTTDEYDAYLHLTASANLPYGQGSRAKLWGYENIIDPLKSWASNLIREEPSEESKFNIPGLVDFPDQTIQDALNNMVGTEYFNMAQATGKSPSSQPIDAKAMFLDPRAVTNLNMDPDPIAPRYFDPYMMPSKVQETSLAEIQAMDPAERPSQLSALRNLIGGNPESDDYMTPEEIEAGEATRAAGILNRYSTPGSQDLGDIFSQVDSFAKMPDPAFGQADTRIPGQLGPALAQTDVEPYLKTDPMAVLSAQIAATGKATPEELSQVLEYQRNKPSVWFKDPSNPTDEEISARWNAIGNVPGNIPVNYLGYDIDPAKEAAATMGYLKPEEFGLDPFTNEQIREARATFQKLMEGAPEEEVSRYISPTADPYIYQDQIAEALRTAQTDLTPLTGVQVAALGPPPSKTEWFNRRSDDIRFPYPETGFQGIPEFYTEPVEPATFIGDEAFVPSFAEGGYTIAPSGPVVGGAPAIDTFADIPVVQPGAEVPWTPPAPVIPDITQALADFSAIRDADEDRRNREQDERERELEQAADDRREAEQEARVASARNKTAEKKRIDKENKERKAEEKRISDSQAAAEKKRRASDKQMADMLKMMNETHQAYLDRKKEEEERRLRQGYGVGDMWT